METTIMFISIVALVGWNIWLSYKRHHNQVELKKLQLQWSAKALDKYKSSEEFFAFLQSREGQALIYDGQAPNDDRRRLNTRFLQVGTMALFVGVGLYLCAVRYDGNPGQDLQDVLAILNFTGTVAISMGIGLFAVPAVIYLWEKVFGNRTNGQK